MKILQLIKTIINDRKFRKTSPAEIKPPFYMEYRENILFLGKAYVGPGSYWSGKGGITIGDNTIFGPRTTIWTYNHNHQSDQTIPYGGADVHKSVTIAENVWIGMNSIILPGVSIGEGAVIAAGAVVTHDVPNLAIVAGNPATIKKYRDRELYMQLKRDKKLYLHVKEKNNHEHIIQ